MLGVQGGEITSELADALGYESSKVLLSTKKFLTVLRTKRA